jgi:hypothetical protein
VRQDTGAAILASVIIGRTGARRLQAAPAQRAVLTALLRLSHAEPPARDPRHGPPLSLPAAAAARRFAALPPAVRHVWLARHLTALRAGGVSLGQLP